MTTRRKQTPVQSPVEKTALKRMREFTEALENGEIITRRFRCKNIILDLQPEDYDPALVQKTRKSLGVSQSLFAQFLGVSTSTVQKWERGDKSPDRGNSRFMDEIRLDKDHWRKRLLDSVRVMA